MLFFLSFDRIDYVMVARSENDLATERAGILDTNCILKVCSLFLRENPSRGKPLLIWASVPHQKVLIPDFFFCNCFIDCCQSFT